MGAGNPEFHEIQTHQTETEPINDFEVSAAFAGKYRCGLAPLPKYGVWGILDYPTGVF